MASLVPSGSSLTPAQVRAASDQRFEDARCLFESGQKRYNGTVYLCGLVVDCLLKAKLLEKHPHLRHVRPDRLAPRDRRLWTLVYRGHELEEMLAELPEVTARIADLARHDASRLHAALLAVCAGWTVRVRYSPAYVHRDDALEFYTRVKELRPWLR